MKRFTITGLTAALVALALLLIVSTALAQTGGDYDLSWSTIDGGGGESHGGGYHLMGTAGQPDAGTALSGGAYTLVGGFWPGAAEASAPIYLPVILRQY
jgi:hypothetical protein